MLILLWTWGCGGPWLASEYKRPPLAAPTDAELVDEIFPQHLPSAQPLPAPEPKYFTHTVRGKGETFISIARWYTGSGNNWLRLAQANPDTDSQRIQIGDSIRIPEEIVTTRRPMPMSAPSATVAGKKLPLPEPRPDVELFGPIETDSGAGHPENAGSTPALETLD
jgi:hypothetical protein